MERDEMVMMSYELRMILPDTCPVCGSPPCEAQSERSRDKRMPTGWMHYVKFECGNFACVEGIWRDADGKEVSPEVRINGNCKNAYEVAAKLLKEKKESEVVVVKRIDRSHE